MSFLKICGYAVRYDLSAIWALNILYFIVGILFLHKNLSWFKFAFYLFIAINSIAFAFEFSVCFLRAKAIRYPFSLAYLKTIGIYL